MDAVTNGYHQKHSTTEIWGVCTYTHSYIHGFYTWGQSLKSRLYIKLHWFNKARSWGRTTLGSHRNCSWAMTWSMFEDCAHVTSQRPEEPEVYNWGGGQEGFWCRNYGNRLNTDFPHLLVFSWRFAKTTCYILAKWVKGDFWRSA